MTTHKAILSETKKPMNKSEIERVPTVQVGDTVIRSYGPLMPKISKALVENGASLSDYIEAYRGDTLCLKARTLSQWIEGTAISPPGEINEGLREYHKSRKEKADG